MDPPIGAVFGKMRRDYFCTLSMAEKLVVSKNKDNSYQVYKYLIAVEKFYRTFSIPNYNDPIEVEAYTNIVNSCIKAAEAYIKAEKERRAAVAKLAVAEPKAF